MDHSDVHAKHPSLPLFIALAALCASGVAAHGVDDLLLAKPLPKPVRIPAEFEPMQAVVASFDYPVPNFYRRITEDATLVLLWDSEINYNYTLARFADWGVNLENCEFVRLVSLPIPCDKIPWFMFIDHNEPAFVYNQDYPALEYRLPPYGLELGIRSIAVAWGLREGTS